MTGGDIGIYHDGGFRRESIADSAMKQIEVDYSGSL